MKLSWYTNYYLTNLYQLLMEKCSMWYTNYRGHNNWYVRPPTDGKKRDGVRNKWDGEGRGERGERYVSDVV